MCWMLGGTGNVNCPTTSLFAVLLANRLLCILIEMENCVCLTLSYVMVE